MHQLQMTGQKQMFPNHTKSTRLVLVNKIMQKKQETIVIEKRVDYQSASGKLKKQASNHRAQQLGNPVENTSN